MIKINFIHINIKLVLGFLLFSSVGYGQSYFQGSLPSQNVYIDNIASAGIAQTDIYNIGFRKQWTAFDNQPQWMLINASIPLYSMKGGIGVSFDQLTIGLEKNISASVSYNYIYMLGDGIISAGFSLGISQVRIEGSKIRTPDGVYNNQITNHNDDWLPKEFKQSTKPIFGSGIYYLNSKGRYGLSIKDVMPSKLNLTKNGLYSKSPVIILSYRGFYKLEGIQLVPLARVKTDFVQTQIDLGVNFNWGSNILLGTAFRGYSKKSIDAWILKGGVSINKNIKIFYAYDYPVSELGKWSGFVHELLMKIEINHPNRDQLRLPKVFSPRML